MDDSERPNDRATVDAGAALLFAGPGEMRALCRAFDWSATPLGLVAHWSPSLRVAVGIVMAAPQPMWIGWGPDYLQIYNDAHAALSERHPRSLGRPAAETTGDIWPLIAPDLEAVRGGGPAIFYADRLLRYTRQGELRDSYYSYSYSPIPDATAPNGVGGVLSVELETTDRVRAMHALEEEREQQEFLLRLADRLRAISDPIEVMRAAAEMLGRRLGVAAVQYLLVRSDGDSYDVAASYDDGRLPAARAAEGRLSDHGPGWGTRFRAGESMYSEDSSLLGADAATWREHGVRSGSAVPLLLDGRLAAVFVTGHHEPRQWSDADKRLQQRVADRTWASLERARAEAALRDSEEQQSFLLKLSDGLRRLDDPMEIQEEASRILGQHLGVDRTFYAQIDLHHRIAWIEGEYVRGHGASVLGQYDLSTFPFTRTGLEQGRTVVIDDVETDPSLDEAERAGFRVSTVRSMVSEPLFKAGELVGTLCALRFGPYHWTEREIALVRHCAERTWEAVERATAEKALRDTEERLRLFGEASADVLWIRDAETLWTEYLSRAFETIYGRTREEVLLAEDLHGWLALVVPEDRDAVLGFEERVRDGESVSFEYRIRRPDGEVRTIRETGFPIFDAQGVVRHIGGIGREITAAKSSEADGREASKTLESVRWGTQRDP